jgi:hypothetical protein
MASRLGSYSVEDAMSEPAGKGEHHVYRIASGQRDGIQLSPGSHYVGVDAVAWFINKESSFFEKRIASGTLDIQLAGGSERYQAALGTYDLKGGAKIAPVFERPVLPDRNYRGGNITFSATITAIKRDTVVGGMLKSAANASLGIVAGMVQTATLTGPAKLLSAAGDDLIAGVKRVLNDTADKREPFFDFTGLEYTVKPNTVDSSTQYLLLHRGSDLDESLLSIVKKGQLELPQYEGAVLDDGVWLLLRLRRSEQYPGFREWFDQEKALRSKVSALVDDVKSQVLSKDEALARLRPSPGGDSTLFDEFSRLRALIQTDGVIAEKEALAHVVALRTVIDTARRAIAESKPAEFKTTLSTIKNNLLKGAVLDPHALDAVKAEAADLLTVRSALAPRRKSLWSAMALQTITPDLLGHELAGVRSALTKLDKF